MIDTILFKVFSPEIFLCFGVLCQILFNIILVLNYKSNFLLISKEIFSQITFLLLSVLILYSNIKIEVITNDFVFLATLNEYFIKILYIAFCFLLTVVIWRSFLTQKLSFFEFFIILLLSIFSLLILFNTFDLITVYLLIELQSLCFYLLACFLRKSSFSTEAGLKYFISGLFISGNFLLGCSLVYGCLGTLNLNFVCLLLQFSMSNNILILVLIGLLLITATFLFKISAVPFHFWTPDVYEGSPLSSTIIFSLIPKVSLFTFLMKLLISFSSFFILIKSLLLVIGLLSIFFGTFFAMQQKRIKRIVIYSSIVQVGFLVLGVSVNTFESFSSVYFYLFIYLITAFAVWNFIVLFYTFQKKTNEFKHEKKNSPIYISHLSSFFENNTFWALLLSFLFFSSGGIPPFTGFFAKLLIMYNLIDENYVWIVFFLIMISIFSVFYYLRFIKILFFEKNVKKFNILRHQSIFYDQYIEIDFTFLNIIVFLLVYIFFYPDLILLLTNFFVITNIFF